MTYVPPTISGYSTSAVPDDGSQVSGNKITFASIYNNLTDPLKNYIDAINSASVTAFDQLFLGNTTTKSANYTVSATNDSGKLIVCTNAITITLPPAADCGDGFNLAIVNNSSGSITVDGNASETVNGSLTQTISNRYGAHILVCNGTAWYDLKLSDISGTQTSIASASTTDLGTITTNNVSITGTTTITSFGSSASTSNPIFLLTFAGALTLTHNATSLILPGGANITTAAGDTASAEYLGSGNWRVRSYMPATGKAVIPQSYPTYQYLTSGSSATYTTPAGCRKIRVRAWGGGGGGGSGFAGTPSDGGAGGDTSFNSVVAKGGSGGNKGTAGTGVAGGRGTTPGTGTANYRVLGSAGGPSGSAANQTGGAGGVSSLGGAGAGGPTGTAGTAAFANSGSGGGGGGPVAGGTGGGGGQAGEHFILDITSPAATYTYTVGAAGAASATGTWLGAAGGDGLIIVEEFY
jgi:hypothetical protein